MESLKDSNTSTDETEVLKSQLSSPADPYSVVELAIKISLEQNKAQKALKARDAAIQRLSDAYTSIEQKIRQIEQLQNQVEILQSSSQTAQKCEDSPDVLNLKREIQNLESLVKKLREEIATLKEAAASGISRSGNSTPTMKTYNSVIVQSCSDPLPAMGSDNDLAVAAEVEDSELKSSMLRPSTPSGQAEDTINARNKFLAALPLSNEAPDEALKPIIIPASYANLYEFLATVPGPLRTSLSNYHLLHQLTTSWCPQREEHGYYLIPVFKCHTNPRVATAHRWNSVDVISKMNKPSECFYKKDGVWYYAGLYKSFRMADLTVNEWEALSDETTQILVKETIEGRKNTSPQNIYEVNQLYAAGALKVAVMALQCVGFNHSMYQLLLDHASKCSKSEGATATKSSSKPTPADPTSKTSSSQQISVLYPSAQNTATVTAKNASETGSSARSGLALGLGLGSGNIWNTNLGVGLTFGTTGSGDLIRNFSKGIGEAGGRAIGLEPSANTIVTTMANMILKATSTGHTVRKAIGPGNSSSATVRDENDRPHDISN